MVDAQESSAPRVRSQSIGSMSQLLLQGWAMLADSCPQCGVPLMRHPSGAPLLCVNCGSETAGGAPAEQATALADAARPAAGLPAAPQGNGIAGGSGASSDGEEAGLLQAPPSLRSRLRPDLADTGTVGSPSPWPSSGGRAAIVSRAATQPPSDVGHVDPPVARRPRQQPHEQGRDASKAIAEMMLDGWAMLGDHCPRCLNPLLRSRDRARTYCAGCQLDVVRQGAEQPRPTAAGTRQAAQLEQLPQLAAAPHGEPAQPASAALVQPSDSRHQGAPSQPSNQTLQQHVPAVDGAAAAVATRLAAAATGLAAAPSPLASSLLAEVEQCAAALQALAECRRSLA